jgi:hypothetical protein
MSLFQELKRRNVIRIAILYLVSSWVLLQLADVLSSLLNAPEFAGSIVVMLLVLGFFPALIFAWVYEMTPEGLKREVDVDRSQSMTPETGKKLNVVIDRQEAERGYHRLAGHRNQWAGCRQAHTGNQC